MSHHFTSAFARACVAQALILSFGLMPQPASAAPASARKSSVKPGGAGKKTSGKSPKKKKTKQDALTAESKEAPADTSSDNVSAGEVANASDQPAASQEVVQQDAPPQQNAAQSSDSQETTERPWAKGVAPDEQRKALLLFREGNALLKDSLFGQAANKYREALSHWDHPAIHYNLVLALLNLDRPTEVLTHLNKAMAYGPEPIDTEKYEQARNYKVMVESQLAHLVIRCDLEGAVVAMDGQELFVGPGEFSDFVRPGPHAIVAKKEGYVNNEVSPSLAPGQRQQYDMVLMTATEMTEYRRLWPVWRPWAVFGAGIVVAGIGAALHIKGRQSISEYDDALNQSISTPGTGEGLNGGSYDVGGTSSGTIITTDLANKRSSGERNQKIAMAMYGIGGAAIITGSVLLYLNRPRPYVPESSGEKGDPQNPPSSAAAAPKVTVLPMISPDSAGVMAAFEF